MVIRIITKNIRVWVASIKSMQFFELLKAKQRAKAEKLYKEIKGRVKTSIDNSASTILASLMGFVLFASGSNESQFLAEAGFTLLAEFLVNSKDKNTEELIEEIKGNEELKKELATAISEIVTDKDFVKVDDKNWINSLLLDMRREIKGVEKVVDEAEGRLTQILFNGSGLTRLSVYELTNEKAEKQFKEWLSGFPFGFAAIYHEMDYRRDIVDDAKNKLKEKGKAVIVGESGTSKSTIWMRVICEYLKDGYEVLYNEGSEIDFIKAKDYIQCLGGDKVLIAVDNAHTEYTAPIYRLMTDVDAKYLITIREPDFIRFVNERISKLDEPTWRAVKKFQGELEQVKVKATFFTKDEIIMFFNKFGEALTEDMVNKIFRGTRGHPLIVRFFLTGSGLSEHVRDRHDRFIGNDWNKMIAMMVCTLLDLGFRHADENMIQIMRVSKDVYYLDQATLYLKDERWKTIHHVWAWEWLTYLFKDSSTPKDIFISRIRCLRDSLDKIIGLKNDVLILDSIDALFQASLRKYIDIDLIINHVKICDFIEKLSDDENKAEAYALIEGNSLLKLGRYDEAIECFDKAIEIKPELIGAWTNKGITLHRLGRYNEAIECFDKVIKINPDYTRTSRAWSNKGIAHDRLGRHDEALECFDKAIEINPDNIEALNNMGTALKGLGRHDEALECFDKAIKIDPESADTWYNKGNTFIELGRYDAAIECYDKALKIDPYDATIWYNKGAIFHSLSKFNDAITCYKRAYVLRDNLPDGDRILHYSVSKLAKSILKYDCTNIDIDLLLIYSAYKIDIDLAREVIDEFIKIDPELLKLKDELGLGGQ